MLLLLHYSDSQPTELMHAFINLVITPLAVIFEIGNMWAYVILLVLSSLYQFIAVINGSMRMRLNAAHISFGIFCSTVIMFLLTKGLYTPTHFIWIIFILSSLSILSRLKREKIYNSCSNENGFKNE